MYLVDTHQHLWDLGKFKYSWCANIPPLNRTFALEDYAEAARGLEIRKTIFMECDVDEPYVLDEARYIAGLAEMNPLISGIVASGRPESQGFEEHLDQLSALRKVRGIRRVLHTQPDELSGSQVFVRNIQRLASRGLTFDVCVLARQLPAAIRLVRACPEVTFILDHCGVPNVKDRELEPWRRHITELSACPNLVCKVSGLVAYADSAKWTVADLRPFVEHVVEAFGWHRLVWGGDWPVCTLSASLAQWVEATHQLFAGASADERAALFHRNAERIYRV
jgi:predicted TIM-barrel fold metal-dependent hydrolase